MNLKSSGGNLLRSSWFAEKANRVVALCLMVAVFVVSGTYVVLRSNAATAPLTWAPPALTNPETVLVTEANHKSVKLAAGKDYIVKFPDTPLTTPYKVDINGGRNVVIRGGKIVRDQPSATTYYATGLKVGGWSGTMHIEGMDITGSALDDGILIDTRIPGAVLQIQNTRIGKVDGSRSGHHGDCLQNWGGPTIYRLDRVTCHTVYQGMMIQPTKFGGPSTAQLDIRNSNFVHYGREGYLFFRSNGVSNIKFTNVYANKDTASAPGYPESDPAFKPLIPGNPPSDFAASTSVGLNYKSPGYADGTTAPVVTPAPAAGTPTPGAATPAPTTAPTTANTNLTPLAQTPVMAGSGGDIADDSAVYIGGGKTWVVADDKDDTKGGVYVYDASGKQVGSQYPVGKTGNIDLREGVSLNGSSVVLVGANNRSNNKMNLWTLNTSTGALTGLTVGNSALNAKSYGYCLGKFNGQLLAFVTRKDHKIDQFSLTPSAGGFTLGLMKTYTQNNSTESCVFDDAAGVLYAGEDNDGDPGSTTRTLFRYDLGNAGKQTVVDSTSAGRLSGDIEGLATFSSGNSRYLVASSQGSSKFVIYNITGSTPSYVNAFKIVASGSFDATEQTDGISIGQGNAGTGLSAGVFVAHDGVFPGRSSSNLKYVSMSQVLALVGGASSTPAPTATPAPTPTPAPEPTVAPGPSPTPEPTPGPTTPPAVSSGLSATYFNGKTLSGTPVLEQVEPKIDFKWGAGSPSPEVNVDDFSARWIGAITAPETGSYTFRPVTDDGVRLWVNNTQLVNDFTDQWASKTDHSAQINLVAGQQYPIVMEYYEHTGSATAQLKWSYGGKPSEVIPANAYVTSTAPTANGSLISESFDSTSGGMIAQSGTWSVVNGRYENSRPLEAPSGNGNIATHQTPTAGNFTLQVDAKVTQSTSKFDDFSVLFDYVDANNYWYASFNESNDNGTNGIFKIENGAMTQVTDFSRTITPGQNYKVGIRREGMQVSVFLDGVRMGTAVTNGIDGAVGVGSRNNTVSFDNLKVDSTAATPDDGSGTPTPSPSPTPTPDPGTDPGNGGGPDPIGEAPGAPQNLRVTGTTATSVTLAWNQGAFGSSGSIGSYLVFRAEASGAGSTVGTVNGITQSFTDTTVTSGQSYVYTVVAQDTGTPPLQSQPSASVTVNTGACSDAVAPSLPTNFAGTATQTAVTLTWGASTDSGACKLAGYVLYQVNGSSDVEIARVVNGQPLTLTKTGLAAGTSYTFRIKAFDGSAPVNYSALNSVTVSTAAAPAPSPENGIVLAAAGDIQAPAADLHDGIDTALLMENQVKPDYVVAMGDLQYDNGSLNLFNTYFSKTWGRPSIKSKLYPAPGNHEYRTAGGAGYYDYFKAANNSINGKSVTGPANKGYYAFDIGSNWRVYSMNSEDAGTVTAQNTFLSQDMAANKRPCTIMYYHKPYWDYGIKHQGDGNLTAPWMKTMYANNGELVLTGHEHNYQHFKPANPNTNALDAADRGLDTFVIGTGGNRGLYPAGGSTVNNANKLINKFNATSWGVVKFTLKSNSYTWEYIPVGANGFSDSGSGVCH